MGNKQPQQQTQPQQQQILQQTTQQIPMQTQVIVQARPDLETEFLDLVLPNRKERWNQCLQQFHIHNMDGLIAAYGLDRQSRVGRRCNEAEHLILNNYFLRKQKEEEVEFEETQVVLEPLMTVIKSEQLSQLNLVKQNLEIRNILIVGITGQGKTTFINSFISYLMGINTKTSYRNNRRYYVIRTNNASAESDTQEVISYQIEHEGYLLNLIDTPGLGDTKGFEQDQIIISKITKYLEEDLLQCGLKLHAVLVVSQSSTQYETTEGTRTLLQMAMLNILKLFGKNMCEYSKHVITFSDFTSANHQNFESERSIFYSLSQSQKELYMQTKNLEHDGGQQYYQFQNSVLKAKKIGFIEKIQFEKNISSYASLLKKIQSNKGFELDDTKIVINERIKIRSELDVINSKLKQLIDVKRSLQSNVNKISIYEKKIQDSKDYLETQFITKCVNVKALEGEYFTNCLSCNKTCHEKCKAENTKLYNCTAMIGSYTPDGRKIYNCDGCKCSVDQHRNQDERWLFVTEALVKIIEDLKKENDEAKEKKNTFEVYKQEQEEQILKIDEEIKKILKQMKLCLENLLSSALYKLDISGVEVFQYIEKCFPQYKGVINEYQEKLPELTIYLKTEQTQNKLSYQDKTYQNISTEQFQKDNKKDFRHS